MASRVPATADTFPKLLIRNARLRRPAGDRHKDLGIWQSWTWARLLDDVRAYAVGPAPPRPEARRHHRHRRRQPAAALLVGDGGADARRRSGAGLCRRGRRRTRLCARPRRRALRRGRGPGAGRQNPFGVGAAAEARADGLRRAARACATTTTAACTRSTTSSPTAARRWRTIAELAAWLDAEIEAGKGSDTSIILYTSGTTGQSKGVVLSAVRCISAASDTVAFDKLDREATRRWPICRSPGSATIISTTRRRWSRLLHGLSGERPTRRWQTCSEIGPTFYFAPPRISSRC